MTDVEITVHEVPSLLRMPAVRAPRREPRIPPVAHRASTERQRVRLRWCRRYELERRLERRASRRAYESIPLEIREAVERRLHELILGTA